MKTQINNLVNGSQNVAGTNQKVRNEVGEKLLHENGNTLTIRVENERGTFEKQLTLQMSTTGKSWWYRCNLTDEEAKVLGYNMDAYTYDHRAGLTITMDARTTIEMSARKTENHTWKTRTYQLVDNKQITIL